MVSPKLSYRKAPNWRLQSPAGLFGWKSFFVACVALTVTALVVYRGRLAQKDKVVTTLFIAIGSKPSNFHLRDSARRSWLQWASLGQTAYKFFSDHPQYADDSDKQHAEKLLFEAKAEKDMVLMKIEGGYGTKEDNNFLERALYQFEYASKNYDFDYFLRVDDDSFLCLHRLMFELKSYPSRQFFMGRFWCKPGRHRADENFMLFSSDLAEFIVGRTSLVPMDPSVTFAWNFGLLAYTLNLTIFDDQERIDAQQGYLTDYMHANSSSRADSDGYKEFCEKYIYAHHVRHGDIMKKVYSSTQIHLLYDAPEMRSHRESCKATEQSFIPARHSRTLPDIIVGTNNAAV